MQTIFIPTEAEIKRWIKEAVEESLKENIAVNAAAAEGQDLISRKEAAKMLQISLVTLHYWMKKGLPFYKQRGRVYFVKQEVLAFIRRQTVEQTKVEFLKR